MVILNVNVFMMLECTVSLFKKGKRNVQGVPQSQSAALPRQEEEETNPNKRRSNKRTKSTKISSPFPKRGNRNAKRTEKKKQNKKNTRTK